MLNFIYAMLLILTGSAVGAALFGAYAMVRLYLLGQRKKIITYATILLAGTALTQGVLLARLIQLGEAAVSWATIGYLMGLSIQSVGLIGSAKVAIDKLAAVEERERERESKG